MGFLEDVVETVTSPVKALTGAGAASAVAMPLISTALGFGSSLINGRAQSEINDRSEANAWNMFNVEREDKSRAVQTRAKDMEAAGINPLLAAGDAAEAAHGSNPSMVAPQISSPDPLPMLNFIEQTKNNAADRNLKAAQAESLRQNINVTTPVEKLMDSGSDFIDRYKNNMHVIKNWESTDMKPILKGPIKKNPNKKTQRFQEFWNNRKP